VHFEDFPQTELQMLTPLGAVLGKLCLGRKGIQFNGGISAMLAAQG